MKQNNLHMLYVEGPAFLVNLAEAYLLLIQNSLTSIYYCHHEEGLSRTVGSFMPVNSSRLLLHPRQGWICLCKAGYS